MEQNIIRVLSGEKFTPYSLARKLGAVAILESSSFDKGRERYSLLMIDRAFTIEQRGPDIIFDDGSSRSKVKSKAADILDVLEYFASQHEGRKPGDFPFPAGGMGYLSFEFARYCDSIYFRDKTDSLQLPDALYMFGHVFLVFDHYTDQMYLIGLNYREHRIDIDARLDEVEATIGNLDFTYLQDDTRDYDAEIIDDPTEKDAYTSAVARAREYIIAGDILQVVPSRRLSVKTELPAIEAYRRLRQSNPSPYLFYLDFGTWQLFGSSPEVHVKVRDGLATMRPIAGTRRRGEDREEDMRLREELLGDPKERAEHLMLVDLARNDLGRVCRPGTVQVSDFMIIEQYSHVMHIVSEVHGRLVPGTRGVDAIRATFPAGTVSGAPKIRAIEIIDELEDEKRGFYAGLVGYMEPGGNLDTCITIRSAMCREGIMTIQAGAGVVYDSDPDREYEETQEKLGALLRALDLGD